MLDNRETIAVSADVEKRIQNTGVGGMDFDKARELGVFLRISNLLCVVHTTIVTAYRVYAKVDNLLCLTQSLRKEIKYEMNLFDKAFVRFIDFWTGYYAHGSSGKEANYEVDRLYHKIMEWMEMPEDWHMGDALRTKGKDVSIKAALKDGRVMNLYNTDVSQETLECTDKWCVMRYDPSTESQEKEEGCEHMEKSDALKAAKRLSAENPQYMYAASIMREVLERRHTLIPYRVYQGKEEIGRVD